MYPSVAEQTIQYHKWYEDVHQKWTVRRYDIINHLIKKYNFKKYLEIGAGDGVCFKNIKAELKHSVDPAGGFYITHTITSDQYFENLDLNFKYDIIFVDGLHTSEQAYVDLINSLRHIEENGIILCHDINPPFEICQRPTPILPYSWNGDAWKAFVRLRGERKNIEMYTIDTDWGIGVIKKGQQKIIALPFILEYSYFDENRKYLLNLISVEEFFEKEKI